MANTQAKPDLRAVTIAVLRNRREAETIRDRLKTAGIDSFLVDERSFAGRQRPGREYGAVKLQVARTDVERAIRVLGARPQGSRAQSKRAAHFRRRPTKSWTFDPYHPTIIAVVSILLFLAALFVMIG